MKLFIITGTSKGLGRALADELAISTENVVIEMGRGLSGKNASRMLLQADFSDFSSIDAAFKQMAANLAGQQFEFAVLINNAGVVEPVCAFEQLDAKALENNIAVNVTAPILATKAFANLTRNIAAERLVVNISSGAAKRAIRGWTAYCTAKAALEMATRVIAEEARESDPTLSVCSLAPGVVDTPMQEFIRKTTSDNFPDVQRFREMKENGVLRGANAVARDIISLIHPPTGKAILLNGGNYDIRELIHA